MDIMVEKSADERQGVIPTHNSKLTMAERIAAVLPRSKGQRIIVRQVGDKNFRANWFSPAVSETGETVVAAWQITDSRFLLVEESGASLNITDKTLRQR